MGERMEGEGDLQRAETQKGTETRSQLECEDKKYKKSQSAPGVHKSWGWTMQRPSGGNETLGGQWAPARQERRPWFILHCPYPVSITGPKLPVGGVLPGSIYHQPWDAVLIPFSEGATMPVHHSRKFHWGHCRAVGPAGSSSLSSVHICVFVWTS
jgi:hypothetical protein